MNKFIHAITKNSDQNNPEKVKEACGKFSGIIGIITNFLLFAGKFIAGTLSSSVSVTADGFNNLSDAGTSLISLISFKLSGKPADKEHPFGHARIEYITSMIVSFFVLMVGIELLKSSVDKIIHPEESQFQILTVIILFVSIAFKLGLYLLNHLLGKKVDSIMMQAAAADSLSDILATSAVLICLIVSKFVKVNLDGYVGIVVAAFILYTGFKILKTTMNDLIGMAPPPELTKQITDFVRSYDGILGVHDLMVHSYGTGRCFASVHAEVSGAQNFYKSHELVDKIEKDIFGKMGIQLVIHIDPIDTDDENTNRLRAIVAEEVDAIGKELDSSLTIHDFRVVPGTYQINLIFDVVIPYECKHSVQQVRNIIERRIHALDAKYQTVITIDRK